MSHLRIAIAVAFLTTIASPVLAHPETGVGPGVVSGFWHPLGGLDHILAMVAIGLLGAMLGGRSRWQVPATFIGIMIAAATFAVLQVAVPFIEQGILGSLVILGAVIAFGRRMAVPAAACLVAIVAVFHGQAHGAGIPSAHVATVYIAGFAAATVLLNFLGLMIGLAIQNSAEKTAPLALRASGAAIATVAVVMVLL